MLIFFLVPVALPNRKPKFTVPSTNTSTVTEHVIHALLILRFHGLGFAKFILIYIFQLIYCLPKKFPILSWVPYWKLPESVTRGKSIFVAFKFLSGWHLNILAVLQTMAHILKLEAYGQTLKARWT